MAKYIGRLCGCFCLIMQKHLISHSFSTEQIGPCFLVIASAKGLFERIVIRFIFILLEMFCSAAIISVEGIKRFGQGRMNPYREMFGYFAAIGCMGFLKLKVPFFHRTSHCRRGSGMDAVEAVASIGQILPKMLVAILSSINKKLLFLPREDRQQTGVISFEALRATIAIALSKN